MTAKKHPLYYTIHGHFYQPPRENPWTGSIEVQPSAFPDHDWNERIARQCYSPNAFSRILSPQGRVEDLVNNYAYMSFNMGPTLLSWIRCYTPATYKAIQQADRQSAERLGGHGNAIAQVYNHIIMPLASRQDRLTQIRWGIADFEFHFGRKPEGMWLAETAINMDTIVDLIQEGIRFTVLAPTQATSFRRLGEETWTKCEHGEVDTTRPYRIYPRDLQGKLLCEGFLDVFFYDGPLSSAVGFEHLLRNADTFGGRIRGAWKAERKEAQLISVATDGESYGHHEPFGDMCAAYLFRRWAPKHEMVAVNYGWFLEQFPPRHEAQIKNMHGEGCAWSCAHGVGRWYRDCGCSTGGPSQWNQKWRGPLREAFNLVKQAADEVFVKEVPLRSSMDPWELRDRYAQVLLLPPAGRLDAVRSWLKNPADSEHGVQLLRLLESQRQCLFAFTSCGWFFNDIEGLEPVQNMRYALRALELLRPYQNRPQDLKSAFLAALAKATANESGRSGSEVLQELAQPRVSAALKIIAEIAVRDHLGLGSSLPVEECYVVAVERQHSIDRCSLYQGKMYDHETGEHFTAAVLVLTDDLGRTSLLIVEGDHAWKGVPLPIHHNTSLENLLRLFPGGIALRLRQLLPDSVARINRLAAQKYLHQITEDFRNFPARYGLSLDCLVDKGLDLPDSMRKSLSLSLNADLQGVALQSLQSVTGDLLIHARTLIEEAKALGVNLALGGLGKLFHERLLGLIDQAVANREEQVVRQITSLITLGDWLGLEMNKTDLENHAFVAYGKYCAEPRGDWRKLRPMFEWLNFEFPEHRSLQSKPS